MNSVGLDNHFENFSTTFENSWNKIDIDFLDFLYKFYDITLYDIYHGIIKVSFFN